MAAEHDYSFLRDHRTCLWLGLWPQNFLQIVTWSQNTLMAFKWPNNMLIVSYVITEHVLDLFHDHRTCLKLTSENKENILLANQFADVFWWCTFRAVWCVPYYENNIFHIQSVCNSTVPTHTCFRVRPPKRAWEGTASVTGWSLVQGSITGCVCSRNLKIRRSGPDLGCCATERNLNCDGFLPSTAISIHYSFYSI